MPWRDTNIIAICQKRRARARPTIGLFLARLTAFEPLSTILGMSFEELIGVSAKRASKRGPASKLELQLQQVSQLPRAKQKMVSEVLDSLLSQASR